MTERRTLMPEAHVHCYIDGAFIDGTGDEKLTVVNPATEEEIARGVAASPADARTAVAAARAAFDEGPWPALSPEERGAALARFADGMEARRADLLDLAVREVGTPILMADMIQVQMAIDHMRHFAERAASFSFAEAVPPKTGASSGAGRETILKEPVGVVAAFTPFNVPVMLGVWKIGPALAMGNTMVLKPSPYVPLSSIVLAEIAHEADLPPGVLNVVVGGADVGEALTTHPDVDVVSFTGSDVIGRQVMAQAAGTLKRVVLELGGKSANVVFADVDLDNPAFLMSTVGGFVTLSGQACGLTTRILVQRAAHDALVQRLEATLGYFTVGDPADPAVFMGPLVREAQRERVENYIRIGRDEGATVSFGGGRPALDKGYFVEPTLFTGVDNAMRIAQEEIFGPVAVVIPFDDEADAVAIANDSRYGLCGSVWSADVDRANAVAGKIRAGFLTVNGGDGTPSGPMPRAPFGGYKQSGIGRENGDAGLHEYLELKTVSGPARGAQP